MAARSSHVPPLGAQNDDAVQYVSRVSDFDLPSVCVCVLVVWCHQHHSQQGRKKTYFAQIKVA